MGRRWPFSGFRAATVKRIDSSGSLQRREQHATVRIAPGAHWGALNGADVSVTNFGTVDARSAITATAVAQRGTNEECFRYPNQPGVLGRLLRR